MNHLVAAVINLSNPDLEPMLFRGSAVDVKDWLRKNPDNHEDYFVWLGAPHNSLATVWEFQRLKFLGD